MKAAGLLGVAAWTALVVSWSTNPAGAESAVHTTAQIGVSIVREIAGGLGGAAGTSSGDSGCQDVQLADGSHICVPDGFEVQVVPPTPTTTDG